MADKESKTEDATPKKLAKMREQGQVPTSADVAGAATAFVVLAFLAWTGSGIATRVGMFSERIFLLRDAHHPMNAIGGLGRVFFGEVLTIAALGALGALVASLVQTRGLFALEVLEPKPERLNPAEGIKKVLPTPRTLTDLGKSLAKVLAVGVIVIHAVSSNLPRFTSLPASEPASAVAEIASVAGMLVLQGLIALAILAALDYAIVRRRFFEDAKMEKQEVKQEAKDADGDPKIKAKRMAKARQMANQRAVVSVEKADCLVTNPTHIACALRYGPEDAAPILIGMGIDPVALRMRVEARKHGVPIVENKPLARALKATAKIGQPIPVELYEAAAPVIAHVLRLKGVLPAREGAP
jgi:flagellar biosynthetic protein FlhB